MNDVVVRASGLTRAFGRIRAVNGIDLSIKEGEIFGLLGPDGAGKSTLIRLLCGLLTPDTGTAEVLGFDTVRQKEAMTPGIGYVSEVVPLYWTMTVKENIDFFSRLRQVPAGEAAERKQELLSFAGLHPYVDRKAEQLSGGMKKKLALCCALIHSPRVLFLDEPTTGVDPLSRRDFWEILFQYVSRGVTICISTPYTDEAEKCHRLALIHNGEIIGEGQPGELKQRIPGEVLEISTTEPWQAVGVLKGQEGVFSAQVVGASVRLVVDKADARVGELEATLKKNNINTSGSRRVPFSMEDVFITLLGTDHRMEDKEFSAILKSPAGRKADGTVRPAYSITVSDLTKRFGGFTAVDGVSFNVKRGEIFGFLGPNGAGKSTTIRMLCGILAPTSGRGVVLGYDISREPERLKPEIGYMSQKFSLYKELTVEENIDFYAGLYGVRGKEKKERKEWILEMSDLKARRRSLAGELAGGWKQRLALGCAIIHNPEIVFLDEPTAGMDPISRRQFWFLLNQMSARGTTVFVTTHYMDEAEHCQTLGLIYRGKLAALGSPETLKRGLNREGATIDDVFVSVAESLKGV
ncbi:MAG: ATP-binding cassette domain-containing protein [Dehalococcoidia bacterium]|nr:ATP-binding cassette domain-containing protein [Dehalococcoidia bacterium]MDZ4246364.1 ATP-binding cassette domain-containing protein [Dehalococcoidia bacterium]